MSGPMDGRYVSERYSPDDAASQPTIDPMTTTPAPVGVLKPCPFCGGAATFECVSDDGQRIADEYKLNHTSKFCRDLALAALQPPLLPAGDRSHKGPSEDGE